MFFKVFHLIEKKINSQIPLKHTVHTMQHFCTSPFTETARKDVNKELEVTRSKRKNALVFPQQGRKQHEYLFDLMTLHHEENFKNFRISWDL